MNNETIFRAINTSNIETIEVLEKTIIKRWEYTDILYWETSFLNRKKHIKVDTKWYCIEDFKCSRIFADSNQEALENTQQFETDDELLEYLGNQKHSEGTNKYVIIDKKLYIKPRIKITFISGQTQYIYFDNTTKAIEYVGLIKNKMDKEILIYC